MATVTETEEEFYRHTIHMGHRQNTQQVVAGLDLLAQTADDKFDITPDSAIGEHHTL